MKRNYKYEVYALLWVSHQCEEMIKHFLLYDCKIPKRAISNKLHLTVYYGRRQLPGLVPNLQTIDVVANTLETRFMVLAPGGENARPEIEPNQRSVGIRLTKRNNAIDEIQRLRSGVYCYETPEIIGSRKPTSSWKNCFGSRHYQPHIKLLWPNSEIESDLSIIGEKFRSKMNSISFDRFEIVSRSKK